MEKQSIAIVGLGKMGSAFLEELLGQPNEGVEIVAVVEKNKTAGLALAIERGIKNLSIDELIEMGDSLDILFDLTGVASVRQEIRDKLRASENHHTIVWTLISSGAELPGPRATGY
jgi:predicted dinucleotide-utilizing enzyme